MRDLLAGWSRYSISPPVGQPMAGYIARQGSAQGVHDPLFVRVLVFEQGAVRVGIVLAELLLFSNRWTALLRKRFARAMKTSPTHVIVAATHTHSGPQVDTEPFSFAPSGAVASAGRALQRRLENRMERAVRMAMESLQPVRIEAGTALIRGVASDRNHPQRATAQPLSVIRIAGRAASAVLAIYGCHPTVLGAENLRYSGDLHGEIARRFERTVEVALVANGAAANISTRFTRKNQNFAEIVRLADRLMKQGAAVRLRPFEAPELSLRTATLRLPLRNLDTHEKPMRNGTGRLAIVAEEALLIRRRLQASPWLVGRKSVVVSVTVLRLGRIFLAALPFEVYSSTGNFLWKRARVIPLCYANGYWGYVPARSACAGEYETVTSLFSSATDEQIRRIISLLASSS